MKRALVLCPSRRDRLNLADERIERRFALELAGPTVHPGFDPRPLLEDLRASPPAVDGIFGSNDATAHLAARAADDAGLPGVGTEAFMRCHDKLAARRLQAAAVPEATPAFAELDPDRAYPAGAEPLPYPFFAKPVVAHLSQLAGAVRSPAELEAALAAARERLEAITAYDRALAARPFRRLIAEELLRGALVTFEAFVHDGRVTPIGVTDAVLHRNAISFVRFEYPSRLPGAAIRRMVAVAERVADAAGLGEAVFNIEFFVDRAGGVSIVEVNARMASQFAPLVRAVHGVSTYELALALATGETAELPAARPDLTATSFVVRVYGDGVVRSVPDAARIAERFPDACVELLVEAGQRLADIADDDVASHRLAVVALAAPTREAARERFAALAELLRFEVEPAYRTASTSTPPNAATPAVSQAT